MRVAIPARRLTPGNGGSGAVWWRRRARLDARLRNRLAVQVWRIEVILAGDADEREERVAAGVGQGCPHAVRGRHVADRAYRPIRGDPFARGVGEYGSQRDRAGRLVDRRGLQDGDLVLAQGLAHDVEAA